MRTFVGAFAASAITMASLAVFTPPSGAATYKSAGESAFCKSIFTFHPTTPAKINLKSYEAWAKTLEPFYAKLASEAPNGASRRVLGEVVLVLKYYEKSTSLTKLDLAIAKYHSQWLAGTKALAAAIVSCAKSYT